MKSIKLILTAILLTFLYACSDNKDDKQQCNCKPGTESTEIVNKTAILTWDNTINMYFLAEYNENEQIIDGGNVYIVDREQDIEKIRSLNKKDIIFSGIATKSTYLPNPHIAGTEYYCIFSKSDEFEASMMQPFILHQVSV